MTKELQTILAEYDCFKQNGETAILATVVDVRGSSYRLPGARMLISETGASVGTISGGCLEADVVERAKTVLKTGEPQVFVYDTTANEDSVFSLNMGCRGVIRILLESVEDNKLFEFVAKCAALRRAAVIATVINSSDAAAKIGQRVFLPDDEVLKNDSPSLDAEFESSIQKRIFADAANVLQNRRSDCKTYKTANGAIEIFLEFLPAPLMLTIFGAGHDAAPLVRFAKELGWHVSLLDHRAAFAAKERFPLADFVGVSRPDDFRGFSSHKSDHAAIVMTHNYAHDKEIIRRLLNTNAVYIGALGPKRRAEQILRELRDEQKDFPPENLEKLFAPVGLDIGAASPETIALSIVAEISAVFANRNGGFLRERAGSIYNRDQF